MKKKLKTSFMNKHPLRSKLKEKDWQRIEDAFNSERYDDITTEELEALNDVLYDSLAWSQQTHFGITTLQ